VSGAISERWQVDVAAGEETSAVFEPAHGTPGRAKIRCWSQAKSTASITIGSVARSTLRAQPNARSCRSTWRLSGSAIRYVSRLGSVM